jgi:hypothetical protein
METKKTSPWLKVSNNNERMTALYDLVMQDKNVQALINSPTITGEQANGLVSNVIVAVCSSMQGLVFLTDNQMKQLNLIISNANLLKLSLLPSEEGVAIDPELNAVVVGDTWDETPVK